MPPSVPTTKLLFICLGNICRSPVAEGIFLHLARERGVASRFEVESAGTGAWHVGHPPDRRSIEVARRHGVALPSTARQVCPDDFVRFDHLIVMDRQNEADLREMGAPMEKACLLLSFHPGPPFLEVPDPYYGGPDGFEQMFDLLHRSCLGLLDHLLGVDGRARPEEAKSPGRPR